MKIVIETQGSLRKIHYVLSIVKFIYRHNSKVMVTCAFCVLIGSAFGGYPSWQLVQTFDMIQQLQSKMDFQHQDLSAVMVSMCLMG